MMLPWTPAELGARMARNQGAFREARARITVRIRRLSLGNPGDVKPVGGGDKRRQDRDIAHAIELAGEL